MFNFLSRYVSLAANYKRQTAGNGWTQSQGPNALPAQIRTEAAQGVPPDGLHFCVSRLHLFSTGGAMAAQPLIIISKPPEMTGRKAMGPNVNSVPDFFGRKAGKNGGAREGREAVPLTLSLFRRWQPGRRILCIRAFYAKKGRYE